MHYVICYDLENDRLRDRCAKLLEKNGCRRVQKSVFAAADMAKKDLTKLQLQLRQLFARTPMSPGDSVLIIPLPNENTAELQTFGSNNICTLLGDKKLKIML